MTEADVEAFIGLRIRQLAEEGAQKDFDLRPALRDYYARHMADGTFVAWLALEGEAVVGTSGMSFVEKPPWFGCPSGRIGLLSSMYTRPDRRRRGIARALLEQFFANAKSLGYWTVQCSIFRENTASQALHEKSGFRQIGYRERVGLMSYGPLAGQWRDTLIYEKRL